MLKWAQTALSRRSLLGASFASLGATALYNQGTAAETKHSADHMATMKAAEDTAAMPTHRMAHGAMITVGDVDNEKNGFDPTAMLTDWYTGTVSTMADGRTLRSFEITVEEKEIEIAPGVMFPAWTYNGRVPGPAIRAMEGERLKIVLKNYGSHPHSLHFHGIHSSSSLPCVFIFMAIIPALGCFQGVFPFSHHGHCLVFLLWHFHGICGPYAW